MKVFDEKQGSLEWLALRAQYPTASEFGNLITPAKLQVSKSMGGYVARSVIHFVTQSANMGREVARNSRLLGMNTEEYQQYAYAARMSGLDAAAFTRSVSRLGMVAAATAAHTGTLRRQFPALAADLSGFRDDELAHRRPSAACRTNGGNDHGDDDQHWRGGLPKPGEALPGPRRRGAGD